jgi:4-amino-4-deoxy-L-arabinose transferase-like glycosyltransferase
MTIQRSGAISARLGYALLTGLVLLHVALAITYANITPYRTAGYLSYARSRPWSYVSDIGAPDERQHANYVIHILEGKGLPVNQVMVPDSSRPGSLMRNPDLGESYEFHQAPLFYVLDAGFGKLAGVDATGARDPDVGKRLRYLNALFGAGTVLGVYFLGLWAVRRRDVAFLAAAIAALLPMNLALSGALSNDPLLFCICTWASALCARGVREGWDWETRVPLAILVGLGFITKETALALIPLVFVAFLLRRPKANRVVSSILIPVVIALPVWIRNQRLYGDPLGLRAFEQLFAGAVKAPDMMAANGAFNHWFNYVGWYTVRSFFGVFGYMDIFLNERGNSYTGPADASGAAAPNTLYRALFFLAALAALGFLLYLAGSVATRNSKPVVPNKEPETDGSNPGVQIVSVGSGDEKSGASSPSVRCSNLHPVEKQVHLMNAVFLGVVTLLFIRYNMSLFQGQARYFFPALGPICLGLSIGALYWAKSRRRLVIGTIVAVLFALNVYALTKLPGEFAKRIDPSLANQVGCLEHPKIRESLIAMQWPALVRSLK